MDTIKTLERYNARWTWCARFRELVPQLLQIGAEENAPDPVVALGGLYWLDGAAFISVRTFVTGRTTDNLPSGVRLYIRDGFHVEEVEALAELPAAARRFYRALAKACRARELEHARRAENAL